MSSPVRSPWVNRALARELPSKSYDNRAPADPREVWDRELDELRLDYEESRALTRQALEREEDLLDATEGEEAEYEAFDDPAWPDHATAHGGPA